MEEAEQKTLPHTTRIPFLPSFRKSRHYPFAVVIILPKQKHRLFLLTLDFVLHPFVGVVVVFLPHLKCLHILLTVVIVLHQRKSRYLRVFVVIVHHPWICYDYMLFCHHFRLIVDIVWPEQPCHALLTVVFVLTARIYWFGVLFQGSISVIRQLPERRSVLTIQETFSIDIMHIYT